MLTAELKGKVPSKLANSEDLLTSSVFGSLKYLSSPSYLQSIIQSSINITGGNLRFNKEFTQCNYEFWPRLNNCEPDLLLHLKDTEDEEYIICIEAKYWSGKSSEEDTSIDIDERQNHQRDQLAREIEDIHTDFCLDLMHANKSNIKRRLLIYLTNDTAFPYESIKTSVQHIQNINYPVAEIFWLTWRGIYTILNEITNYKTFQDSILLNDIKLLLEQKGLKSFDGFTGNFKQVSPLKLTYYTSTESISWAELSNVESIQWNYGGTKIGNK